MKHTKGPWKIDRFEDKVHQRRHTILGNGLMICETWSIFEDEETEANARLIASAPELLEEHIQWGKILGHILVKALQGNDEALHVYAKNPKLTMRNGEPFLNSNANTKAEGKGEK